VAWGGTPADPSTRRRVPWELAEPRGLDVDGRRSRRRRSFSRRCRWKVRTPLPS
jgi:hypothetical protein